ncbi:MAG: AmmeMemoRadiSam system radical SAM enzyme [Elusimicrobiota bacterium]
MNIFNKTISRRDFCRLAVVAVSGLSFVPVLARKAVAGLTREKGFVIKKEARWYKRAGNGLVRCELCPNRCTLREGDRSNCLVREVENGILNTLAYGNPAAVHVDPIEKKPLYHYFPGETTFSIATAGCNFTCLNCQNWQISQMAPEETENYKMLPEDVVKLARQNNCGIISYTYSEPSVFYEYMFDTAVIARENGIKNTSITNGFLNPLPLKELCSYLDAANVDIKGFSDDFYMKFTDGRLQPVLDAIVIMKENGVHVEITNLLLPGQNDSDDMVSNLSKWIIKNTGPDTPLHFSRFTPMYKLKNLPPTPQKTLEKARKTAMDAGMYYVYIGNVHSPGVQDTVCHNCGKTIINRTGYFINSINMKNGCCAYCNAKIPGRWD